MERVEEAAGDVFENDIEMYLKIFCEENNIEDMTTEPQSRWNACLMYINKYVCGIIALPRGGFKWLM